MARNQAIGRIARVTLGPTAALLLGGAGGFLAWAVPASLIGKAARHLHLVALLPQAAPPYSETTRLLLAAGVGLVLAAAALLGFRRLEHGAWLPARATPEPVDEAAPVALRRFARAAEPARRAPLFASELMLEEPFPEKVETPSPLARPVVAVALPAAEPLPDPETPVADPAPPAAIEPADIPPPPAPVCEEQRPASWEFTREPPPARAPVRGGSVAELMARLEAGLARRPHDHGLASRDPIDPPLGDALRDALTDLQKLARR